MNEIWQFITGACIGWLIIDAITLAITEDSPILGTILEWIGINAG